MEARQRPAARSRIPSLRARTSSVPRPQKQVEFSPCTEEQEKKKVRRKWRSFNVGSPIQNNASENGSIVRQGSSNLDILNEWREELADEQSIPALMQLASDLTKFSSDLGSEEKSYRREQALYWLCKAAERGCVEARQEIRSMLNKGQGINEANFEVVHRCASISQTELIGRRLGRKMFKMLDQGRGYCTPDQIYKLMQGKDLGRFDEEDVQNRIRGRLIKLRERELVRAGVQFLDGSLPDVDRHVDKFREKGAFLGLAKVVLCLLSLAIISMMSFFGHSYAVTPLLCLICVLGTIYVQHSQDKKAKFIQWRDVWKKKAGLVEGIFEAAASRFEVRRNIDTSLIMLIIAGVMAKHSMGFYLNLALFLLTSISVGASKSHLLVTYIILGLARLCDPFSLMEWLSSVSKSKIGESAFEVAMVQTTMQMLPVLYLPPIAIHTKCPQILWPPLMLTTTSLNPTSLLWISASALTLFWIAMSSKIHTARTLLVIVITGLLLAKEGQIKQRLPNSNPFSWSDYATICEGPSWQLSPKEQLQCSRNIGLPITWEGKISGIQFKLKDPNFIYDLLDELLIDSSAGQFVCRQLYGGLLENCPFSFKNYECGLKIDMWRGRLLGGDTKTIQALVKYPKQCLDLEIGKYVNFEGTIARVYDTQVYINHLY